MTDYADIWDALENPPVFAGASDSYAQHAAELYHWSTNYEAGRGPFTLFLDLIGWSAEHIGESLYQLGDASDLGYVELGKLGRALNEYADTPQDVRAYVDLLLELESR